MSTVTAVPIPPVKRSYLVWLWLGIVIAVIAAVALVWAAPTDPVEGFLARNRHAPGVVQTASGLQYQVLQPGKGNPPTDTDIALVNYEGKLPDGTTFDKSQRPTPMPVVAGDEKAGRQGNIPGVAEALKLMPKGSKYRFWIKPSLAYGDKGNGPIPAHSLLTFDVELLDYMPATVLQQMQQQMMMRQQMLQQQRGAAPGAGAPPPIGQ